MRVSMRVDLSVCVEGDADVGVDASASAGAKERKGTGTRKKGRWSPHMAVRGLMTRGTMSPFRGQFSLPHGGVLAEPKR